MTQTPSDIKDITLDTMGTEIDTLTEKQRKYLSSGEDGT